MSMAAVGRVDPLFLGLAPIQMEQKVIRYGTYAATALAIGAASIRYGTAKIGFTLAASALFVQGHKIIQIVKDPEIRESQRIVKITERVFTLSLIGGLLVKGLALSLLWREGKLVLEASKNISLQGLLENAPTIFSHANHLTLITGFAIPSALDFIHASDDYFYGTKLYADKVDQLCRDVVKNWTSLNDQSLLSLYGACRNTLFTIYEWGSQFQYLPQSINQECRAAINLCYTILYTGEYSKWIKSVSNTPPEASLPIAEQKNSDPIEKIKYAANTLFFHSFNLLLMSVRLYHHPLPTAGFFILGLFYPTVFQQPRIIQRKWTVAPDFMGLSILKKLRYLYEKISMTSQTLHPLNYPAAAIHGLYLAETFRYLSNKSPL